MDVDIADFNLVTSGVTDASITSVSGSGATRTVSVNTGSSIGIFRLDVSLTATITDLAGNPLTNTPYTNSETYMIDKIAPTAGSLAAPNVTLSGGTTYSFAVTFRDNLA